MTKTSTQTTPGAERAASPRRSAPEAILEQCLDKGRAGIEHGGKDGPQAGVEVQFTARQCVPTALDGSQVIERRPRSKTPPESLRGPVVRRSGRPGWLPGRPRASALAKASPTCRFQRQNRIWRSAPPGHKPARAGRGGNTKNLVPRGRGFDAEPLAAPQSNLAVGGRSRSGRRQCRRKLIQPPGCFGDRALPTTVRQVV